MIARDVAYGSQLRRIVRGSPQLMAALRAGRALQLASWCIGAGAVRNLVWDHLHGFFVKPTPLIDVDLVYFDAAATIEQQLQQQAFLSRLIPDVTWDVTNQALVHTWYDKQFGFSVPPVHSLEQGLASWAEYATCVGVYLDDNDDVHVIAPHGLDDLFNLRVRHNAARASAEDFVARHTSKRWKRRWPDLLIVNPAAPTLDEDLLSAALGCDAL